MNRTPEGIANEAIEEFWKAVHAKHGAGGVFHANALAAMSAPERHAFDAAVASMVTLLQLRTLRLCAVEAEKQ